MTYNTAKIRQFLNQYFNDEELKHLCFDYFPDVYRNFAGTMALNQKVQLLLEHCQKYQRFPHLLAALEKEHPTRYPDFFPAHSTIEPTSTSPNRNPRQVFISYAHQDSDFAHQLAEDLQAHNIPVWIAPESIHPGEKWVAAINRGLEESGAFLLTLTPDALTSHWVQDETNAAIELQKEGHIQFIPLLVKPCSPPPLWRVYQRIPFDKEYQAGLRVLLSRLGIRFDPKPSPVMLNEVREVKHLDGGGQAEARGILRSADYAQNDSRLARWLARLRTVPMPIWGVVAALVILLAWAAYNGLSGNAPSATPTTEVAQNSPAATQAVPPPNAQLGDTWTRPTDGMVMVYVPAGTFLMGSTQTQIDTAFTECQEIYGDCSSGIYDDEKPQHEVTLDGFLIDRTEVANEQYGLCVQAGACEASALASDNNYNGDNYPVVGVSWNDANAYCQWTGGSLPTEAQWEYAARGPENRIYPWEDEFDGTMLNFCDNNCTLDWKNTTVDDGYQLTAPVGSYPGGQSWVGAMDMAGNVWEWVADWYEENYYSNSPDDPPPGPETGSAKVLRGGSWNNSQPNLRAANRDYDTPVNRYNGIGFRCLVRPGN